MSSRESTAKTLLVAFCLCVACSIVVSSTAVVLKPRQDENRLLDRNKNILTAAGMFDSDVDSNEVVAERFAEFSTRVVDLNTGEWQSESNLTELGIDLATYDQRSVINDARFSEAIPRDQDIANLKRRVVYPLVYVKETDGAIDTIVIPVDGYGLWGIMYGFLALEGDANTVRGLAFYELKETPGLGAEVRNPNWMALWPGKKVYNPAGEVGLRVVKGAGSGDYQVDGLSGATLTSRGVDNLIQYWLGEAGYGPALRQLQEQM